MEKERKWQSTPVFLPGKSHGQRNLVGYSLWGHKAVGLKLETVQHHHHNENQKNTHTHTNTEPINQQTLKEGPRVVSQSPIILVCLPGGEGRQTGY